MLQWCAHGFGALALSTLSEQSSSAAAINPLAPKTPHFAPRAKSVIFLYMDGGPSHVDTFDYKPTLNKFDGQDPRKLIGKLAPTQFDNIGTVLGAALAVPAAWRLRALDQFAVSTSVGSR